MKELSKNVFFRIVVLLQRSVRKGDLAETFITLVLYRGYIV